MAIKEIKNREYDENWCILEDGYSSKTGKHYEGLFTQGNGYMDVRGSLDEGIPKVLQDEEYERKPANVTLEKGKEVETKWGTYIPGIVGKHPNLLTEIINLPYFMEMVFFVGDERLSMDDCHIKEHKRYLDLRDGSIVRSFIWQTRAGLTLKLEYIRFLSYTNRHLAVSQVKVTALNGEGDLSFAAGINAGVRTNGFNHFTELDFGNERDDEIYVKTYTNGGNTVCMTSKLVSDSKEKVTCIKDNKRIASLSKSFLKEGDSLILQKFVAVSTDRDLYNVDNHQVIEEATKLGASAIFEAHQLIWQEKWDKSDVIIEGDDRTQKALRMSTYHLLRSNNDEDDRVAICAKGYAGEAYFGRYFWDTEINMLPFFIYTNPDAAKKLLMFRYNTLEGAKRNARSYGYTGARYPWESSVTGDEECANWQYCDHEVHVTADIIYAIEHFVKVTKDVDFVKNYAIDIMVETSRYWCGRVDKNTAGGYSLLGVMGPDEYLPMTSNNRYTNYMVKFALDSTIKWIAEFKRDSALYEAIAERLSLTEDEIVLFEEVAGKLVIGFDENTDIILQCDEFLSYADLDFDEIWKDRSQCFGAFISQEKNYRSKALKQADVLEMMMLFPNNFSREQLEANYDYYEPLTTHDSSLSAAVHGILAAWMDRDEEAFSFLQKVIDIDMSEEKCGAKEGIHIANCGGLWQLVVFGFAGFKSAMSADDVAFQPHLPKTWKSVSIPLTINGQTKRYVVK